MQTRADLDSLCWKEEFRKALRGSYSKLSQTRIQISNLIFCPRTWAHENRLALLSYCIGTHQMLGTDSEFRLILLEKQAFIHNSKFKGEMKNLFTCVCVYVTLMSKVTKSYFVLTQGLIIILPCNQHPRKPYSYCSHSQTNKQKPRARERVSTTTTTKKTQMN